uniref:Cytochrome c oxidase assembly factor 5 n=1 Tax=Setaria digitata TaxID=48799 RepID=A0A915Q2T6_9BILA
MAEELRTENEEKPRKKPGRACDHIRQALKRCLKVSYLGNLLESDCVQKEHRHALDCLHSRADTVPIRCFQLLETFAQCKLSLIDNRLRTRGRKLDIPDIEISSE